jgi:hypothetical protein
MTKNTKDTSAEKDKKKRKKKVPEDLPDVIEVSSDQLREAVTETVTKLMAEDVLGMDDEGVIDLKDTVEFKKKNKKKEKDE